jgi:hypothetical protein
MILHNVATSVLDIFVATKVKLSRTSRTMAMLAVLPVVLVWARSACVAGDLP